MSKQTGATNQGAHMKTTLKKIREHSPCAVGWEKLLKNLGKVNADDDPLTLLEILDSNGLDDAIWCLRAVDGYEKEIRLFAVWCARQVQHLMTDSRSIAALDVAERHAQGKATNEELSAAETAARAAARDAAETAARADAWAAARDAAETAAETAARVDAWAAAWTAARTAAWAAQAAARAARAARTAAWADAWDAVWIAARTAAWAAQAAARAARADAWAAARAAAWAAMKAAQEKEFRRICTEINAHSIKERA